MKMYLLKLLYQILLTKIGEEPHSLHYTNLLKCKNILAKSTGLWYLSQNNTLMVQQEDTTLSNWIDNLQSQGKSAFSLETLQEELHNHTKISLKRALSRLSQKKQILSIHRGYYLIIPAQYRLKGILPATLFLDGLMSNLGRPYYVGLLNAAAFHGASHQQPQAFFVVTTLPALRPTLKKGLKINYISKTQIPQKLIELRKMETGYLKISNPILTATDLIHFEKRVGGMNRVATILNELTEVIQAKDFVEELIHNIPVSAFQRLGYLIENIFENQTLADAIFDFLQQNNVKFYRIPLKASASVKGFMSDERWKIIINTQIEIDE